MQIANEGLDRMEAGAVAPAPPVRRPRRPALRLAPRPFPDRYRVDRTPAGPVLVCREAPTVGVRLERGLSVTAEAARQAPPGSIFLDGAAQGPPFVDSARGVFNLDHHEGCVRAFTLAACEQAMVLVRKCADLRARDWTVHANDADLDTVLAIWVLLNHLRLRDERVRARIMPLLRLEGAIDAQGFELQDLCALPPELMETTQRQMQRLREREIGLKARGAWEEMDLPAYVAARLREIDRFVYHPEELDAGAEIEELSRTALRRGSIAVACRADAGIYEVEQELRRLHGERLGVILLRKDDATYTLRQVDPSLPASLDDVYALLNLIDPAVDGQGSANRWGGSAELGGSPRRTGTRLRLAEVAAAVERAHRRPGLRVRLGRLWRVTALVGALWLAAALPLLVPGLADGIPRPVRLPADLALPFASVLIGVAGAALLIAGRRSPGLYGLRGASRGGVGRFVPLALLGALTGGVWVPASHAGPELGPWLAAILALPLAAELVFRGLVQGGLAWSFPLDPRGGPWRTSVPVLASSALYAACAVLPLVSAYRLSAVPVESWPLWIPVAGSLLFGFALGKIREASESLLPGVLLHALAAIAIVAVAGLG